MSPQYYISDEKKPEELTRFKKWIRRMYNKYFPTPIVKLSEGDRFWVICEYQEGKVIPLDTDMVIASISQKQIDKKIIKEFLKNVIHDMDKAWLTDFGYGKDVINHIIKEYKLEEGN